MILVHNLKIKNKTSKTRQDNANTIHTTTTTTTKNKHTKEFVPNNQYRKINKTKGRRKTSTMTTSSTTSPTTTTSINSNNDDSNNNNDTTTNILQQQYPLHHHHHHSTMLYDNKNTMNTNNNSYIGDSNTVLSDGNTSSASTMIRDNRTTTTTIPSSSMTTNTTTTTTTATTTKPYTTAKEILLRQQQNRIKEQYQQQQQQQQQQRIQSVVVLSEKVQEDNKHISATVTNNDDHDHDDNDNNNDSSSIPIPITTTPTHTESVSTTSLQLQQEQKQQQPHRLHYRPPIASKPSSSSASQQQQQHQLHYPPSFFATTRPKKQINIPINTTTTTTTYNNSNSNSSAAAGTTINVVVRSVEQQQQQLQQLQQYIPPSPKDYPIDIPRIDHMIQNHPVDDGCNDTNTEPEQSEQQHRYSFFTDQSMIIDGTNNENYNNNNDNVTNDDDDNDETDSVFTKYHNASSIAIIPSSSNMIHMDDNDDDDTNNNINLNDTTTTTSTKAATTTTTTIPQWEEEATPIQTQFAKMLLFQRHNNNTNNNNNVDNSTNDDNYNHDNNNNNNDILSTTSEHGSIIEMIHDDDNNNNNNNNIDSHHVNVPTTVSVGKEEEDTARPLDTSNSTYYQTPPSQLEDIDNENDNCNIINDDIDKTEPQILYSKSMIEEIEVLDEIKVSMDKDGNVNNDDDRKVQRQQEQEQQHDNNTYNTQPANDDGDQIDTNNNDNTNSNVLPIYVPVKNTTDYLFGSTSSNMFLQRFGIGHTLSSNNNSSSSSSSSIMNSSTNNQPQQQKQIRQSIISQSAPTTPRASTTWYTTTTTASTNHHSMNLNNNKSTKTNKNPPPSSFLLRSPGSMAFQSVSKKNNTIHGHDRSDRSYKNHSSWFTSEVRNAVVDDKINEIVTADDNDDDDDNNIGVDSHDLVKNNKELLEHHFPNTAMISTTTTSATATTKTNPFRLVTRSCFSFDAYDTSIVDDHYDLSFPNTTSTGDNDDVDTMGTSFQYTTSGIVTSATSNSMDETVQRHLPIPELDHPSIPGQKYQRQQQQQQKFQRRPFLNVSSTDSSSIFKRAGTRDIGYSASWDVATTATSTASTGSPNKKYSSNALHQPHHRMDYRRLFRQNPNHWGVSTGKNHSNTSYSPSIPALTTTLSSSPTKTIQNSNVEHFQNDEYHSKSFSENVVQQLQSPQRIEIERDDAIDILACLVERGVSWKQQETHNMIESNEIHSSSNVLKPPPSEVDNTSNDDNDDPSTFDIASIVEELQGLSLAEENLGNYSNNNTAAHQKRKLALEELLRSHEYAMEMKRASKSASSWLQSIGRSQSSSPTKKSSVIGSPARNVILSESTTPSNSPYREEEMLGVETTAARTYRTNQIQSTGEESSVTDNIDLLTVKAMLHSAQIEAKEKSDLADRLNEELAKCRAEIGRLKSSAQSMSFRSPNRSILDESDDEVVDNDDDEKKEAVDHQRKPTTLFNADRITGDSNCLDSSFLPEDGAFDDTDTVLELERYKAAVKEANTIIRSLYSTLMQHSNEYVVDNVPIVDVSSVGDMAKMYEKVETNDQHSSPANAVTDENVVTEWVDLSPPLTTPPDHDSKSPIVKAVLDLWTDDPSLQESLTTWIDQVLDGGDPDSIPPLTLSSLDQQARDGFVFHILPLLLRRSDVSVDVKTRTHRRTTYDLNVFVDTAIVNDTNLEDRSLRFDPALKPTNVGFHDIGYSDYGTPRSNDIQVPTMSRLSYDEMAEDIALSDTSQPGFISTLGGALGGLLLLRSRKGTSSLFSEQNIAPVSSRRSMTHGTNMPTIIESPHTMSSSDAHSNDDVVRFVEIDHDDHRGNTTDQPYHRVVSAPSGRIGVTFVDFRGHCMVSDVYHDSPLVGWIFPSDVLIAIDDIPVSGTNIRDIIKLLKDRSHNPQRALRVISSHAMNELTLNASAVVNDATG